MIFLKILGKTGIYNFYSDNKSFYDQFSCNGIEKTKSQRIYI